MRIYKLLPILLSLMIPALMEAQQPPLYPQSHIDEMKKVHFLVGEWEGNGWSEYRPGYRNHFQSSEVVQDQLGGMTLLIEGVHTEKTSDGNDDKIVHHALALLSYDSQNNKYSFRSNVANGRFGDFQGIILEEGVFQWRMENPRWGTTKFTIRLNEKGQWHEIGEFSQDGKTWRQVFEMTLQRTDEKKL